MSDDKIMKPMIDLDTGKPANFADSKFHRVKSGLEPEPTQQCGTCKYAKRIDLNMIECHGVPPTPVVCGAGKDALGRIAMSVELMRARMAVKEVGCALWAYNPLSPMLNLPDVGKA